MKFLVITTLFSMMASSVALAGEIVNETLKVPGDISIEIEHQNGDIKIQGWDRDEVKVSGELDDRAEEFIFEQRKGRVVIEVKMPKRKNWNSSGGGDD